MLRGSTPIQLRQLDISPAIQAGALEQQAIVNMYSGIQKGIQNFQEKQEKKQQNEMTVNALKQFVPGLGDDVYKAISKDPQILKSMGDIANIQQARQEQEILATEFEASKADDEALQKAISVNIDTEGNLDKSGLESSYLELGGTNLKLLDLFKEPGEVKVDPETGIITQDGVFKGQVSSSLLDIEPTESELKLKQLEVDKKQAEVDKLLAQIEEIKAGDTSSTTSTITPSVSILKIDGQPLN